MDIRFSLVLILLMFAAFFPMLDPGFWPLIAFVPFFLFMCLWPAPNCPECGTPLPKFQNPSTKTKRQWLYGGYLCPKCGCECDQKGVRVAPGDGRDRPIGRWGTALLASGLLVALLIPLAIFLWHS